MRRKFLHAISVLFAAALFMAGCGGALIQNVDNSNYLAKKTSMAKMERAIKQGGLNRGWKSKKVKEGHMVLEILVRGRHFVAVDVFYSGTGYKIQYKNSREMDYNAQKGTIHGNYNKWVRNLEHDINYELSKAGMRGYSSAAATAPAPAAAPASKPAAATKSYEKSGDTLSLSGKTVYIRSLAPYAAGAPIAENIKSECVIDKQLVDFIVEYAQQNGINVVVKNDIAADELELKVAIVDAVSAGTAFTGHRKYTAIAGSIVRGKKEYYSFKGARLSGGGFWGAYKSSCSVLGRTVKALGQDVALWLASPIDNARLGDQHLIR